MLTKYSLGEIDRKQSLLFKIVQEKAPAICILFSNQTEAEKLNEDLVEKYKNGTYTLTFWPSDQLGKSMNVMLVNNEDTAVQRLYKNLAYDYNKFKWFLDMTQHNRNINRFNFVHIVEKDNRDKMVKTYTQRRAWYLSITKYIVMNEEQMVF